MAVAQRVADERVEKCGSVVGYQIRLESCMVSEQCRTHRKYYILTDAELSKPHTLKPMSSRWRWAGCMEINTRP